MEDLRIFDGAEKTPRIINTELPEVEIKMGPPGPKGDKGDPGEIGPRGKTGLQGLKGDKGDKGDPGKDGKDGKDGLDGKDGIDGVDGKDGRDGKDGEDGYSPVAGIDYIIVHGRDGRDGIDGAKGDTGPQGEHGHSYEGGVIVPTITVTDTYSILVTDYAVICNKTTPFTVTLPVADEGQIFIIKNINIGLVTIEAASSDTIDEELTQSIEQWDSITVICYTFNKWVII